MIATWLAGKLSGLIIFVIACTAPFLLVGFLWEAIALHGIEIPFPIWGPFHLVVGALHARDLAYQARDKALRDLGISQGNVTRLQAGINICNASVDTMKTEGDKRAKAAQDQIDAAVKLAKQLGANLSAVAAIKSSAEACPVADAILHAGFGK